MNWSEKGQLIASVVICVWQSMAAYVAIRQGNKGKFWRSIIFATGWLFCIVGSLAAEYLPIIEWHTPGYPMNWRHTVSLDVWFVGLVIVVLGSLWCGLIWICGTLRKQQSQQAIEAYPSAQENIWPPPPTVPGDKTLHHKT